MAGKHEAKRLREFSGEREIASRSSYRLRSAGWPDPQWIADRPSLPQSCMCEPGAYGASDLSRELTAGRGADCSGGPEDTLPTGASIFGGKPLYPSFRAAKVQDMSQGKRARPLGPAAKGECMPGIDQFSEPATLASVQPLRGIYVQRVGGKTVIIWNPNGDDAISRAAWLALTNDLRRQKGIKR